MSSASLQPLMSSFCGGGLTAAERVQSGLDKMWRLLGPAVADLPALQIEWIVEADAVLCAAIWAVSPLTGADAIAELGE